MSTAARKVRKRAGLPLVKPAKKPTRPYARKPKGLGLTTGAEIMAALLVRGIA